MYPRDEGAMPMVPPVYKTRTRRLVPLALSWAKPRWDVVDNMCFGYWLDVWFLRWGGVVRILVKFILLIWNFRMTDLWHALLCQRSPLGKSTEELITRNSIAIAEYSKTCWEAIFPLSFFWYPSLWLQFILLLPGQSKSRRKKLFQRPIQIQIKTTRTTIKINCVKAKTKKGKILKKKCCSNHNLSWLQFIFLLEWAFTTFTHQHAARSLFIFITRTW